ncbi:hypothetical protein HMPREF9471_05175, partial [[Clostridium] clostridioforme WAL-7855]
LCHTLQKKSFSSNYKNKKTYTIWKEKIHNSQDSNNQKLWRVTMEYSKEDLMEAKRQIDSTLHKLRETIITFEAKETPERYKSQITLAKRRIRAFEIANYFIENEIENSQ